jgi:hypothetical protein
MSKPDKQIFTLYLNSNTGFRGLISNANYANVSWNVDWDALFNRENYNYKYCSVRFRMVGENNNTSIQDSDTTLGVLVANFGQTYTGKNTGYVVLAPIDIKRTASYSQVGGPPAVPTWTNTGTMIDIETMTHANPQQIDMPVGLNALNLQMWKDAFAVSGDANNVLISSSSSIQYFIIFQFELYN